MIPIIGIMIGAYIFTRMIEILDRDEASIVVRLFAALTLLVTVVGVLLLLLGAMTAQNPLLKSF